MIRRIVRVLDWMAERSIVRSPGVAISSDARVAFRKIRLAEGCALTIGAGSIVEAAIAFDRPGAVITIGTRTFVGASTLVSAESLEIGDDVLISWGCTIVDHDSHALAWKARSGDVANWYVGRKDWTAVPRGRVRIGNKAWLGFNVIVLKGVSIGEGAVVGAGSVVTRDIPAHTVAAGNPARVIRELNADER